jgi:hypothetical protein
MQEKPCWDDDDNDDYEYDDDDLGAVFLENGNANDDVKPSSIPLHSTTNNSTFGTADTPVTPPYPSGVATAA